MGNTEKTVAMPTMADQMGKMEAIWVMIYEVQVAQALRDEQMWAN